MTDREKLARLLMDSPTLAVTADYLISNGVTIPVRCKDCKHKPADNKHFFTCKKSEMYVIDPDEYCSYGERKDDER